MSSTSTSSICATRSTKWGNPVSFKQSAGWAMFSAILTRLQPKSIRRRLQLYYLLTLGGSLLLFAALVMSARARTIYQELDADLQTRGHSLVDEVRPSLLQLDPAA